MLAGALAVAGVGAAGCGADSTRSTADEASTAVPSALGDDAPHSQTRRHLDVTGELRCAERPVIDRDFVDRACEWERPFAMRATLVRRRS